MKKFKRHQYVYFMNHNEISGGTILRIKTVEGEETDYAVGYGGKNYIKEDQIYYSFSSKGDKFYHSNKVFESVKDLLQSLLNEYNAETAQEPEDLLLKTYIPKKHEGPNLKKIFSH